MTTQLGDTMAVELLRAHDAIVRRCLEQHGGAEVKHLGDGIMASFDDVPASVASAIKIQQELASYNAKSETPIRVRIGIHAGEPVEESDDLWMVQFCTRTHEVCQNMAVAYGAISKLFRGIIRLGFVATDTQEGDEIARKFGVPTDRAPLMHWFLDDKSKPTQVDTSLDGAEGLATHMGDKLSEVLSERTREMGIKTPPKPKNKNEKQQQEQKKKKRLPI